MDSQNLALAFGCFVVALLCYYLVRGKASSIGRKGINGTLTPPNVSEKTSEGDEVLEYPPVEPLPDFEWTQQQPLKLRPFKPRYHLTMGVTNSDVSSLIQIDKNYLDRIHKRRELMAAHPEIILGAHDRVKPAVDEFYTWLLSTYLPTRFPRMFSLCSHSGLESSDDIQETTNSCDKDHQQSTHLKNHVTMEHYSLNPPSTPWETLRSLGGLVDDDLQFLLPSEDGDGYTLAGHINCFPSGFKMSNKLGLKLRDIHIPVPHYKEKLEKSMDRYFDKLETCKFLRRMNWTVSMTPELFNPKGNHIHEGDVVEDQEFDMDKAILRCELQTVHRLPHSKAILFSFQTYSYSLQEVRDEGLGEDLAEAIDGMRDGSAPGIHRYKGAVLWGEQAKAFLRS